jgi:peptidoglycan/xylan/chitin deacetylase (PgdA/CDA1 family)
MARLNVLFTFDTEVWPGSWVGLDARFPEAFRRYVYGDTPQGQYALPMTLRILNDHGLRGVFFIEPLFSARFGLGPLQEIIGLVRDAGHDVQMHLHPEWADEALEPVLPVPATRKRQHLSYYSFEEQASLIRWGKARLVAAGAPTPTVFRAGSFRFNLDTLRALLENGIERDSSYNHCHHWPDSGLLQYIPADEVPVGPRTVSGIVEFPVTVFHDRPGHLRPLQLTACSLREIVTVLERAADRGDSCVNIVSHNFELLDRRDFSVDRIVVARYISLCRYLATHGDRFETVSFHSVPLPEAAAHQSPVNGSWRGYFVRLVEQAMRRVSVWRRRPLSG